MVSIIWMLTDFARGCVWVGFDFADFRTILTSSVHGLIHLNHFAKHNNSYKYLAANAVSILQITGIQTNKISGIMLSIKVDNSFKFPLYYDVNNTFKELLPANSEVNLVSTVSRMSSHQSLGLMEIIMLETEA